MGSEKAFFADRLIYPEYLTIGTKNGVSYFEIILSKIQERRLLHQLRAAFSSGKRGSVSLSAADGRAVLRFPVGGASTIVFEHLRPALVFKFMAGKNEKGWILVKIYHRQDENSAAKPAVFWGAAKIFRVTEEDDLCS